MNRKVMMLVGAALVILLLAMLESVTIPRPSVSPAAVQDDDVAANVTRDRAAMGRDASRSRPVR